MSNYVMREFRIGEPVFGDQARDAAAKMLDLVGVPTEHRDNLLHYQDGRPRQGFSPVKFLGRKDGFALLGYGPGMAYVDEVAPALAGAWAIHKKRHILQERKEGLCTINPLPFRLQRKLQRVVIQKKQEHLVRFNTDAADQLYRVVFNSLRRQCEFLGLTMPDLDLEITGYHDLTPAKHSSDRFFLKRGDIDAAMNVALKGPWTFGYLSAHGHGHHNADLFAAEMLGKSMEAAHVAQ